MPHIDLIADILDDDECQVDEKTVMLVEPNDADDENDEILFDQLDDDDELDELDEIDLVLNDEIDEYEFNQ